MENVKIVQKFQPWRAPRWFHFRINFSRSNSPVRKLQGDLKDVRRFSRVRRRSIRKKTRISAEGYEKYPKYYADTYTESNLAKMWISFLSDSLFLFYFSFTQLVIDNKILFSVFPIFSSTIHFFSPYTKKKTFHFCWFFLRFSLWLSRIFASFSGVFTTTFTSTVPMIMRVRWKLMGTKSANFAHNKLKLR